MNYRYVGDGEGIPGLPHEISDDEAAELGVSEILKAALENGSYVEEKPSSRPSSLKGEGAKKKE